MPTFTTIALETLLEPRFRDSYQNNNNNNSKKQQSPKSVLDHDKNDKKKQDKDKEKVKEEVKSKICQNSNLSTKRSNSNHIYISPALYTTPELTPVTDSTVDSEADSSSLSPYVFNRKGRGGKVVNNRVNGFEVQEKEESKLKFGGGVEVDEELAVDEFLGMEIVEERIENTLVDEEMLKCVEVKDVGKEVENSSSSHGEFFDANDDFSSDGSLSNGTCRTPRSLDSEMRATRLTLLDEIEKRKTIEETLAQMQSRWLKASNLLSSQVGLTLPSLDGANDDDSIEQLYQEVVVARFVAESIGRGQARAEAEIAAESIIDSKNKEISRLQDRLNYYETVNHEMCQRNQEVIEIARKQRQRKKVHRMWLWSCIGVSITIGATVIAYTYLPPTSKTHVTSGDVLEPSCASSTPEST